MLHVQMNPYLIEITESCGLAHDIQVIEVPIPPDSPEQMLLKDRCAGGEFPLQSSRSKPGTGFLLVKLEPFQRLSLTADDTGRQSEAANGAPVQADEGKAPSAIAGECTVEEAGKTQTLSNGLMSIQVSQQQRQYAEGCREHMELAVPGPVLRFKAAQGSWRGGTFFDTRQPVRHTSGALLEKGPLRIHYRYQALIGADGYYEADVIVDAGLPFARIKERFSASPGDQLVWDFGPTEFPQSLHMLDATAGYTMIRPQRQFDQRHARLAGWTQNSQLFDLRDGYAIRFQEGDCAGFFALEGGGWRGARLNQLELWTRRWPQGDRGSRREVPPEVKADGRPGPESIPMRGRQVCEPHLCVEGWIGGGERSYGLAAADWPKMLPPGGGGKFGAAEGLQGSGDGRRPQEVREFREARQVRQLQADEDAALGHFEYRPDRSRYRRQQVLLRKLHTQFGLMPLQNMCRMVFDWPQERQGGAEAGEMPSFRYPHFVLDKHLLLAVKNGLANPSEQQRIRCLTDYLEARIYGFWEGSGSAYTNYVVSRETAPNLLYLEWLAEQHLLTEKQLLLIRAHCSFLVHLAASPHYYPGEASMLPADNPDSLSLAYGGMCNQNFYTDAFNIAGMAAQVFSQHPEARQWQEWFIRMWHRQLELHMYPDSGLWEESHTYYQHVLHTVLPTLLRRRADGVDDEFANPALAKLAGAALKMRTPRTGHMHGRRHLIAFGDHFADPDTYRYLYAAYGQAMEPHYPELAGRLLWLHREMGGDPSPNAPATAASRDGDGLSYRADLPAAAAPAPTSVQPIACEPVNEYVQGLGFMFRDVDEDGQECLLALRSGGAWAHHHNDDGSIQFFARGKSLIADAAFGHDQESGRRKFTSDGHSRWTLDRYEPLDYLWSFNRGWLISHDVQGPFPYATACIPVIMHTSAHALYAPMPSAVCHHRTVVQLAPAAYLIIDSASDPLSQTVRYHLAETAIERTDQEVRADYGKDCRLRLQAILAPGPLRVMGTDYPAKGSKGERSGQGTIEIRCSSEGGEPLFAMLLTADGPDGQPGPTVCKSPEGWRLQGRGFDCELRSAAGGGILLTDRSRGGTRIISNIMADGSPFLQ
jgi:hypothetical protein